MKKIAITLLGGFALLWNAAALDVPNHSFEQHNGSAPDRYVGKGVIHTQNPQDGKACIKNLYTGSNWDVMQLTAPFIPCEPDTWYRFTVWNRNTAPAGDILYGIRQCKSATVDRDDNSVIYNWEKVKPNLQDWTKYTMEFKTSAQTHGLSIYTRVGENVPTGDVFWDNFSITKFDKAPDLMEVKPFSGVASFTDGSTWIADAERTTPYQKSWRKTAAADERLKINFPIELKNPELILTVTPRDGDMKPKIAKYAVSAPGEMSFDLKLDELAAGIYDLDITLMQQGKKSASAQKTLVRSPKPVFPDGKLEAIKNVKFSKDGDFLVNGKPFVPVFFGHYNEAPEITEKVRSDFGMNTIHIWHDVPDFANLSEDEVARQYIANYRAQMDAALAAGLYVMPTLFRQGMVNNRGEVNTSLIVKVVKGLKDHPALLLWDFVDEPEVYNINGKTLSAAYNAIKQADPDHPVWVNLCYVDKFAEYAKSSDIASYDHYPFPMESIAVLDNWNRKIKALHPAGTPLINYIQSYNPEGMRMPTYDELLAETMLGVIDGMKSLVVYAWVDPYPQQSMSSCPETQGYIKMLAAKLFEMRDFLHAPTPAQPKLDFPNGVRYLYKENGLLVVNLNNQNSSIRFNLPGFTSQPIQLKPLEVRFFVPVNK